MKRNLSITLLVFFVSLLAVAQVKGKPAQDQTSNTEESIRQIEQQLTDDMVKGSPAAFEKYMTSNYVCVEPDGAEKNKMDEIQMLTSGDLKYESSKLDQLKVRIFHDAAVVTSRTTDKCTYKGEDASGQFRWTDVFVKQGTEWKLVSSHGTKIETK